MDTIQKSLSDTIQMFHDRMSKFEADLQKTPSTPSNTLATDFLCFKSFIKEMLGNLQHQMELMTQSIDNLEMRSRRKMLLLHGVTEHQRKEDTVQVVAKVVSSRLKLPEFQTTDIKRCHRMGRPSTNDKPRPILVKFDTMEVRQKIWFSKTNLKGSGVTVSEFLTKSRHQVFMSARERFGVNRCWTQEGLICILGTDGSRHRVLSLTELNNIEPSGVPKPAVAKSPSVKTRRTKK